MTRKYLGRAIPQIEILADELYQMKSKETWEKLIQFIEGLQWLIKIAGYFEDQPMAPYSGDYRQFLNTVQNQIGEMETAISNDDQVLIADLITYEFLPALVNLYETLNNNGSSEETHDLN
jgi:hypothetical protein